MASSISRTVKNPPLHRRAPQCSVGLNKHYSGKGSKLMPSGSSVQGIHAEVLCLSDKNFALHAISPIPTMYSASSALLLQSWDWSLHVMQFMLSYGSMDSLRVIEVYDRHYKSLLLLSLTHLDCQTPFRNISRLLLVMVKMRQYKTKEDGQGSAVTAWLKRAGEEYARDLGTFAMTSDQEVASDTDDDTNDVVSVVTDYIFGVLGFLEWQNAVNLRFQKGQDTWIVNGEDVYTWINQCVNRIVLTRKDSVHAGIRKWRSGPRQAISTTPLRPHIGRVLHFRSKLKRSQVVNTGDCEVDLSPIHHEL
ncbi:hypothetical protein NC653_033021 [Populus alba x Populus x berolinensis]|uniref:Uncharacterized protein n=1 Tax=Populus alba x Populus x berolinensis TaxID=444605 RepID=A0AAD6PYM6_9ROSI|nr:hypothetical protein NC653_033021 [Populus alba x Populus x berolinensis]